MKLGIIDWGIGGIDCMARIRSRCPDLDIAYFSDAGYRPYGQVPAEELAERVGSVVDMLNVDAAIIACNAASTIIPAADWVVPVTGMIRPGVEAVLATGLKRVGVIAGVRTIESGAYTERLQAAGCRVSSSIAQPLSALVEAGVLRGPIVETTVHEALARLDAIECLLLACTHYPALASAFERRLPGVLLLDPMDTLLKNTVDDWALDTQSGTGQLTVWTTGDTERMRRSARLAFGVDLGPIDSWR